MELQSVFIDTCLCVCVSVPRRPSHNHVWDFDVELGETADLADDPGQCAHSPWCFSEDDWPLVSLWTLTRLCALQGALFCSVALIEACVTGCRTVTEIFAGRSGLDQQVWLSHKGAAVNTVTLYSFCCRQPNKMDTNADRTKKQLSSVRFLSSRNNKVVVHVNRWCCWNEKENAVENVAELAGRHSCVQLLRHVPWRAVVFKHCAGAH